MSPSAAPRFDLKLKALTARTYLQPERVHETHAMFKLVTAGRTMPLMLAPDGGYWRFVCPSAHTAPAQDGFAATLLARALDANRKGRRGSICLEPIDGQWTLCYTRVAQESAITPETFTQICKELAQDAATVFDALGAEAFPLPAVSKPALGSQTAQLRRAAESDRAAIEANVELARLRGELAKLTQERAKFKLDLDAANGQIKALKDQIVQLAASNPANDLARTNAALNSQIIKLQAELSAAYSSKTEAERAVASVGKQLDALQSADANKFDRAKLRKQLNATVSEAELQAICYDLNIDHESLGTGSKEQRSIELLKYCERMARVPDLIRCLREIRPHVEW